MKMFGLRIGALVALLLVFGVGCGWAQTSDGKTSIDLSINMYCATKSLVEGNLGVLLGLVLMFAGLWSIIRGGKVMGALPVIIMGALVTALPSLIEVGFQGIGSLLNSQKLSKNSFDVPDQCKNKNTQPTEAEMDKRYTNPQTGTYYPGRGSYVNPPMNSSGSPDDRDKNLNN